MKSEIAAHLESETSEFVSEYRMRHMNGSYIWVLSRGIAVRDQVGKAIRMAGSQTDITEGKVANPLTDLPNRLYFLDRLDSSIDSAHRNGFLFAVLFVDLDRFKLINDSLGHATGDQLLLEIATLLRTSVRSCEQVDGAGLPVVARLGGDEFAILLPGIRRPGDAEAVAERILKQLICPFQICGRQVFASVSIGIAFSSSGQTPEELLRNADTAMYHAKTRGKARFAVFDDGMRRKALAQLELETDLREAIDTQQLVLHYQSQILMSDWRIVGYEALVRWNHPERGLLGPEEFIPVAEETGLIIPLGRWVLKEACRKMAEWHKDRACHSKLTVSVNVSFKQLAETDLYEDVRQALKETGLDPTTLRLEMTESTVMANAETAITVLQRLKDLGVGLEIDDFGTGYSSLSYLSRLPFDTLKIDRSFVRELGSPESSEIVKTILELARSMNLAVVAEGVETLQQLQTLNALGCTHAQGFFFSEPLSSETTKALMREQQDFRHAFGLLQLANMNPNALGAIEVATDGSLAGWKEAEPAGSERYYRASRVSNNYNVIRCNNLAGIVVNEAPNI